MYAHDRDDDDGEDGRDRERGHGRAHDYDDDGGGSESGRVDGRDSAALHECVFCAFLCRQRIKKLKIVSIIIIIYNLFFKINF